MTKITKTNVITTVGDETKINTIDCYEVGMGAVEEMLKKVAQGGDEIKLREELIKNSRW